MSVHGASFAACYAAGLQAWNHHTGRTKQLIPRTTPRAALISMTYYVALWAVGVSALTLAAKGAATVQLALAQSAFLNQLLARSSLYAQVHLLRLLYSLLFDCQTC